MPDAKTVVIRLPVETHAALKQLCAAHGIGMSPAAMVGILVRAALSEGIHLKPKGD